MSKAYIFRGNVATPENIRTWGVDAGDVSVAAIPNTAYTTKLGPDANGDFTLGIESFGFQSAVCVAIARHNISPGAIVWVERQVVQGGAWIMHFRINPANTGNNAAAWLLPEGNYYAVRLRVAQHSEPWLRIGYFFAGAPTELPRDFFVGHTPAPFDRQTRITGGRGVGGDFLGERIERVDHGLTVTLKNVHQDDMRATFLPIIKSREPFFIAQNYIDRPTEVAFAWLLGDPRPTNARPNGMMDITLEMGAIY